jgi:hypothetical protein
MTCPGHQLIVVVDDWAAPPSPPSPPPDREFRDIAAWRSWQLDAMLAASISKPKPLCLTAGI